MKEGFAKRVYHKNLNYVKWGVFWCIAAGLTYGFGSTFQTFANESEPFLTLSGLSLLMLPLIVASMQDILSAILIFIKNLQAGKHREYIRSAVTKPARNILLASVLGGPIALGCYCASILLCGPVYSVAITAILPAAGALLSRIFLKEKISKRGWAGIALCVIGPLLISWVAPTAESYPHFYLGILLAVITAFGWGGEVAVSVAGMDFIDPEVAIGIRFVFSGTLSFLVIPVVAIATGVSGLQAIGYFFTSIPTISTAWLLPAAVFCGFSYFFYYKGANSAGASRAAALNPLFTVSATLLGIFVWHTELTWNFFVGLALLLIGSTLVIGKPSEIFSLRDIKATGPAVEGDSL